MQDLASHLYHRYRGILAIALGCFLLLLVPVQAQSTGTGEIAGRVFNSANDNYLNNVVIRVQGTALETRTDENGRFRLTQVPAGATTVTASFAGSEVQSQSVEVAAGRVATVDLTIDASKSLRGVSEEKVLQLEKFTVTDRIMSGQAIAMQEQKLAPNIKNVISLDEVGEMAEGNIGEFLKFVPGFSVVYSPSTPQLVTLRGMPSHTTQVMIDGVPSSPAGGGRGFDMGVAVTGNVDRLEVVKTPTPDLPANAVGGSVNIISKGGFIRKTPLFTYNTYLTYSEFDGFEGFSPKFKRRAGPDSNGAKMFNGANNYDVLPSFDVSYIRPVNDKVAFTLAASRSVRTNDWIFLTPTWNGNTGVQTTNQFNHVIQGAGVAMLSGKLDWKLDDENFLQFSAVHSSRESFTRQGIIRMDAGTGATGGEQYMQGAATARSTVRQNPQANTQYRNLDHFVTSYRHDGEIWKLKADLSYSLGSFELKDVAEGFFQNIGMTGPSVVLRLDGLSGIYARRIPVINATTVAGVPVNVLDGDLLTINTVQSSPRKIENEALRASFTAGRERVFGLPLDFKVGAVIDRMDKTDRSEALRWNFTPPGGAAGKLAGNYDLIAEDYSNRWYFTDVLGNQVRARWVSTKKMYDIYQANPTWFTPDDVRNYTSEVTGAMDLTETITAAFLRLDARLMDNRLWLVGGVRFEHTSVKGRGPLNDISATYVHNADGTIARDGSGNPILKTTNALEKARLQYTKLGASAEKSYSGYYPSFNASYNISENIVARVAYASTVGRPNHPDIIPNASIADPENQAVDKVITVTNPGLKPWKANNYDFTLEAYNIKWATLSASLFQKDLTGFFSTSLTPATTAALSEYGFGDEYLDYSIESTVNGGSARIRGIELSYRQSFGFLPWWGAGLQTFVNLTKLKLGGPDADNFTEFSPEDINWGVSYGLKKFLIKINTTSASAVRRRLITAASATAGAIYEYRAPMTRTDLSLEYQFNKKFVVYASVRNLQSHESRNDRYNEETVKYVQPSNYQFSPTNFTFGVKGEF